MSAPQETLLARPLASMSNSAARSNSSAGSEESTSLWEAMLAANEATRDTTRLNPPRHAPKAALLTCSDARLAPSLIFNEPSGSLFTVRIAGNTATPAAVASLDYAVSELGVSLIVVLGHTQCGAVGAAFSGAASDYEPLTAQIRSLAESGSLAGGTPNDAEALGELNVNATVDSLRQSSSPVGDAIRSDDVVIVGAIYDLATDTVIPLNSPLDTP